MKITKVTLAVVLLILVLLMVVYAALYDAFLHIDRCVPGGFDRDVNGALQAYDTCYQDGVEVTQWYLSTVTGVVATLETIPK